MFGTAATSQPSNEPAKLDVEVHPAPTPSKPTRKGLSLLEIEIECSSSLI